MEIDKKKSIVKTIIIIVLVLGICITSALITRVKIDSTSNTSLSSDDIAELAAITKEAGSVSDNERTAPTEISISDYLNLYNGNSNSIVLFSRTSCKYCKLATPIIENIIYKYNVKINYVNLDSATDTDKQTLLKSNSYYESGISTPLIVVVGNGKIVDKIEGLVSSESYQTFFKNYGFME